MTSPSWLQDDLFQARLLAVAMGVFCVVGPGLGHMLVPELAIDLSGLGVPGSTSHLLNTSLGLRNLMLGLLLIWLGAHGRPTYLMAVGLAALVLSTSDLLVARALWPGKLQVLASHAMGIGSGLLLIFLARPRGDVPPA
ncbi:MAG: hypothetical protein KDJ41_18705 [Hyphomicrobiaceae bacterium]|nr:hypothetical protein [Hyphomicrobiaceae bacterium]